MRRWRILEKEFPGVCESASLVSCEEAIPDVREYACEGAGPEQFASEVEKEHVMVAVRVRVDGRAGVLLADPGYHVARVVTVMADRCYPHTGWFTQSEEANSHKEYGYHFNAHNANYIEWNERVTRAGALVCQTSLVYVARPYLDGVDVTERRNLVYNFRSLLARDQKGHLVAGIYFPLATKDAQFTLFFDEGNGKQKKTFKFSTFNGTTEIPDTIADQIIQCNNQMKYKEGVLQAMITRLATIMADTGFLNQLLAINDTVCQLTAVN